MKKTTILLAALLIIVTVCAAPATAQNKADAPSTGEARKGQFLLNTGIGFIEDVGITVNVEYGLLGNRKTGALTAGLFASGMWGVETYDWIPGMSIPDTDRANYTLGLRTAYRYELLRRLEIYVAFWTGMMYDKGHIAHVKFPSDLWDGVKFVHSEGSARTYPMHRYM
ncbi:MAG: hypothetical protein LBF90_06535 [Prevotellaceae bacterium]|jgi:hypothetical protein|nr:hypothetical protein [Prevotellaceae bacterium]